jgi:heme/copper-type cytochrome/quinol oxidase subunit 2
MLMLKKCLSRSGALFFVLLMTSACTAAPIIPAHTPSALNPQGPAAAHIASLWWVLFGFGMAVFVLVVVLLFVALLRRRRGSQDTKPESRGGDTGRNWPILGGIALPLVVLAIVFG